MTLSDFLSRTFDDVLVVPSPDDEPTSYSVDSVVEQLKSLPDDVFKNAYADTFSAMSNMCRSSQKFFLDAFISSGRLPSTSVTMFENRYKRVPVDPVVSVSSSTSSSKPCGPEDACSFIGVSDTAGCNYDLITGKTYRDFSMRPLGFRYLSYPNQFTNQEIYDGANYILSRTARIYQFPIGAMSVYAPCRGLSKFDITKHGIIDAEDAARYYLSTCYSQSPNRPYKTIFDDPLFLELPIRFDGRYDLDVDYVVCFANREPKYATMRHRSVGQVSVYSDNKKRHYVKPHHVFGACNTYPNPHYTNISGLPATISVISFKTPDGTTIEF